MLREACCHFRNRQFGGDDDCVERFERTGRFLDEDFELSGLLLRAHVRRAVTLDSQARGLQNSRSGGAHDILAAIGKAGVAGGRNPCRKVMFVAEDGDFQQLPVPAGLGERDLVDLDFRKGLAVAVELTHALLRFIAED